MRLRHVPDRELTLSPAEFVPSEGSPLSIDEQRAAWVRQRAREAGFRLIHDEAAGLQLAEPSEIVEHVDGFVTLRQWSGASDLVLLPVFDAARAKRLATPVEPDHAPAGDEPGPGWLHLAGGGRVLLGETSPARTPAARRPASGEPAFLAQGEPVIQRDGDGWRLVLRLTPLSAPGPAGI